ncbi:hypothetical protein CDAR_125881 [Caerostris darwini]|uniref:Uncharacterized protein n=1 Tax=Caerostris darwini TaxID=1538125 RepID=A0AAV4Q8K9_9ARAC|nr:hypothetical protein CDAR_125881 [Caerostris darwini]
MPVWRSDKPSIVKAVAPRDGFEKQNKKKKVLKCLKDPCSKFLWNIHLKLYRTYRGKSKTRFSSASKHPSLHSNDIQECNKTLLPHPTQGTSLSTER